MDTPLYGRLIFGAAAVLFGVIALMWHDSATWQQLFIIWGLPGGAIIARILAIAQIAGGLAILSPKTARAGAIILGIVYLIFSLASVPGIIASPRVYQGYGSFFEQFPLLCGALAVYAARLGHVARIGMGFSAASFALEQAFYLSATAQLVPAWILPSQIFWAILTTAAFALAAIALLVNLQARLAARLMALMLASFGILVWIPRLFVHPASHSDWSEFALTFLITGAALAVADSRNKKGGRPARDAR